jgi:hypothetical protein
MNCAECEERLQLWLDGRAEKSVAVAGHVATCAACTDRHSAARRLQDGLRLLDPPELPSDFAGRITTQILADRRALRSRRQRWVVATALAASFLLAVTLGYSKFANWNAAPVPVETAPIAKVQKDPLPAPSPRDSVAEAGEAVASLSRKATDETVEQTRLLWPVAAAPFSFEGVDLQTPLEPPAQSLREAGHNVSSGLEPVADSAKRAMNLFWRDLPPVESPKKLRS